MRREAFRACGPPDFVLSASALSFRCTGMDALPSNLQLSLPTSAVRERTRHGKRLRCRNRPVCIDRNMDGRQRPGRRWLGIGAVRIKNRAMSRTVELPCGCIVLDRDTRVGAGLLNAHELAIAHMDQPARLAIGGCCGGAIPLSFTVAVFHYV